MDKGALLKLLKFLKSYILPVIFILICSLLSTVPSIIGPRMISDLMNIITEGIHRAEGVDMNALKNTFLFLLVLYVSGALLGYLQQWVMTGTTQSISRKLRIELNEKLNRLPLRFFDSSSRGDIISRFTNDIDTISQSFSQTVASLLSSIVLFVGVIIMMFSTNVTLSLVCIGCSVIGFAVMFTMSGKAQKYFNKRQADLGMINGHIEEVFTNHHVVKSFNGENEAIATFDKRNDELYNDSIKANLIMGISRPFMGLSGHLAYAAIFMIGIGMILDGSKTMNYGIIISFTMYSRLFSQPLGTFAQSMTSILQASAASRRIFEVLEEKEMEDESDKTEVITDVKGDVAFESVRFGYDKDKEIIHGFSAYFRHGQKVAIVGPTGAGKTTIVNLLMRFYEVNSGSIYIDGISIDQMKRENVRDLFDMILQDTWLFEGTIRENLVYNQKDISDERLDEVCKAVGLRHFIRSLSKGYDTMLDESLSLSEGQKQQLTIARAMIKDSPLLILDEATSSVDTRTELIIQKAMDELTKDRTSFIIAHRLSTIRNADIIMVLNKGDVVEIGSHDELLAKKGFYAELYNSQFEVID
ncbi:MAG: ABC transporter ATP-binding protein [Erysipelotrichaceae bacterium]|nr:ABC transporter ATP-binding protein [Erysipelotrichaceae bacterium]